MSLTLNMVGGGGGGLKSTDALLRVQAPAGSTVTISKSTTTKTDLGHENADDHTVYDYYFIIHQSQFDGVNPWTVTATLNGETATDTIIIDAADEYDLVMAYLVPSEYQAVAYLQASGTQYINTGMMIPSANANMSVEGEITYTDAQQSTAAFGCQASGSSVSPLFWITSSQYGNGLSLYWDSGKIIDLPSWAQNTLYSFKAVGTNGALSLEWNGTPYSGTYTAGHFPTNKAVYLFANNYNGTTGYAKCRLGRTTWKANGTTIGDFVPCYRKSDNVAGMWDRVTETVLTNAGSGSFVVGGDI